jgi:ribosomal protein S27E
MAMEPNLKHWFLEEELELCPDCGEKQLVPPSPVATMRLCLGCGVVPKPTGATQPAEPTGHAAR